MGAVIWFHTCQKGGSVVSLGPARPLRFVVISARGSDPSDYLVIFGPGRKCLSHGPARLGWTPEQRPFKQSRGAGSGYAI